MPRVHEVAKELGVTSKDVLAQLDELGVDGKTHSSAVDGELLERLRTSLGDGQVTDDRPPTPTLTTAGISEAVRDRISLPRLRGLPLWRRKEVAPKTPKSFARHLAEVPMLIFFAFAIAIVIKSLLVQAFFIPSGSMVPTLRVGDRVLVEKVSYRLHDPRRGDVVVFAREVFGQPPDVPWHQDARNFVRELLGMQTPGGQEDYIKRVVAVGGDTIRYAGSPRSLFINGAPAEEPYIRNGQDNASSTITRRDCDRLGMDAGQRGCVVPAGKVFVMGDNRGNSQDSRSIGPVDEDKIVGRAFLIIWPPADLGSL